MKNKNFDFKELSESKDNLILVDVRGEDELRQSGKIPGSYCIPLPEVVQAFGDMDPHEFKTKYGFDRPAKDIGPGMVISCRSGRRVLMAIEELEKLGYQEVGTYTGSFLDWTANGAPVDEYKK